MSRDAGNKWGKLESPLAVRVARVEWLRPCKVFMEWPSAKISITGAHAALFLSIGEQGTIAFPLPP